MGTLLIPLYSRRGQVGAAIVRNDEFGRALAQSRWCMAGGYAVRHRTGTRSSLDYMHKLIYARYHGPLPPGMLVDHKDRKRTNNLPENLRAATYTINGANRSRAINNRSGVPG